MNDPHQYGSSEYSQQAEELFARYLLLARAGTAPDFEEFCDQHPDHTDELYGLHADWDNVGGLLAQLDRLEPVDEDAPSEAPSSPTDEVAAVEVAAVEVAEPEAVPIAAVVEPVAPPAAPARAPRGWQATAALAFLIAVAIGVLAFSLKRSNEVLAKEGSELAESKRETEGDLAEMSAAHANLEQLKLEVDEDLSSAREENLELAQKRSDLEKELDEERERKVLAEAAQQRAAVEIRALSLRIALDELLRSEQDCLELVPESVARSETWLATCEELRQRFEELDAQVIDPPSEACSALRRDFEALSAEDGALPGMVARLAKLRTLVEALEDPAWASMKAWLALPDAPTHYAGFELQPRFGLAPQTMDEETGLLTFFDLRTGTVPADPSAKAAEESQHRLILVPGSEGETPSETVGSFFLMPSGAELANSEVLGYRGATPEELARYAEIVAVEPPLEAALVLPYEGP